MKNNFFVLDDKQSKKKKKKIKRSIEHNLNKNVEAFSLTFFCNKGFVRILIIFTGKYFCRSLLFDKVTCLKPVIH